MKELPVYLRETLLSRINPYALTYTVASSFVSTSPLVVITVVGLLETLTHSHSAELKSFLLTICMLAPESSTYFLFSRLYCGCGGQNPLIERRKECSFFLFFELKDSWQVSMRLRGRIALVFRSPCETDP